MAFCSNCGNNVNEGAVFCSQCGTQILQNSNQDNPQRGEKSSQDYFARERPYIDTKGVMIWSIINCFLCLPVAIYSIVKLKKVNKANTQTEAKAIYRTARISCIIASAIGGLFIIIFTTSLLSYDSTKPSDGRKDAQTCPLCGNSGKSRCMLCRGTGHDRDGGVCYSCDGLRVKDCELCNKRGTQGRTLSNIPSTYETMVRENEERYEEEYEDICPQCENTGERVCYGCNGSGYNRYDNRLECTVCGGRGTVSCPALTCPLKRH